MKWYEEILISSHCEAYHLLPVYCRQRASAPCIIFCLSPAQTPYHHTPPSPAPAPPWRRSPSWIATCAPPGFLDHRHRHTSHQRIHHMAVPDDVERDLPPGGLLPARNHLDPGLFCQAVYCPELLLGAQMLDAPAGEETQMALVGCFP